MGFCAREAAVLALGAIGLSGCVSGHLLAAARRWERPIEYQAASVDGDRLLLSYTALVTNDIGVGLGRRNRRVAVSLQELRAPDLPVEAVRVAPLADDAPLAGTPVTLVGPDDASATPFPTLEIVDPHDGGPPGLVLRDAERTYAPLRANALTRSSTAPWVYLVLPLGVAVDAVGVPVLLFFAPAVMVSGD